MYYPHGLLRLLHCPTWDHWGWVSEELHHSGHGLCKYSTALTHRSQTLRHTSPEQALFGSHPLFVLHFDTDKYRLYIRLHVHWWPGVRWSRRLYQWDQLSMYAQWTGLPAWTDTDCGLQHLVSTVLWIHTSIVFTCIKMHTKYCSHRRIFFHVILNSLFT